VPFYAKICFHRWFYNFLASLSETTMSKRMKILPYCQQIFARDCGFWWYKVYADSHYISRVRRRQLLRVGWSKATNFQCQKVSVKRTDLYTQHSGIITRPTTVVGVSLHIRLICSRFNAPAELWSSYTTADIVLEIGSASVCKFCNRGIIPHSPISTQSRQEVSQKDKNYEVVIPLQR